MRTTERIFENRKFFGFANARRVRLPLQHPTVTKVIQNVLLGIFLPITYLTQRVAKGTQTRLRKDNITRGFHTRLRKGILNSLQMRKCKSLKEKQYGKKLNG